VPGYLVGRLALERIVEAASRAGARAIVVDAVAEAAHRF
jgi:hypothetical protein